MAPTRREVLKSTGTLFAASAVASITSSSSFGVEPTATPARSPMLPYLQNPQPNSMSVCLLHHDATDVAVIWKTAANGTPQTVRATATAIPKTTYTRWHVKLDGLKPGASYSYRVASKSPSGVVQSSDYSFTTPDPSADETKLAIFNDIHDHRETITALMEHVKQDDYDYTLFNGDMINDPSAADGASKVFDLWNFYVNLLHGHSKPIIFVRGNHEVRGSFCPHLKYLFDLPALEIAQNPADEQWQFEHITGPVHFIMMDTGEDDGPDTALDSYKKPQFWQAYRKRQASWLDQRVAAKSGAGKPWRVFVSHIPLHNPASWFSISSRDEWTPILKRTDVSLMLAGHDHSWKFLPAGKKFDIKGTKTQDTPSYPVLIGGGPSMKEGTVILLQADQKKLRARMYFTNGKLLHDFESNKPLA